MAEIVIFAPSPVLEITIEDHPDGADVHLHAGGQGVWQARMLRALGRSVAICSVLSGEAGRMLAHALEPEGIEMVSLTRAGRGGVYIHDRRNGERRIIAQHGGDPLARHELDELYGITLRHALDAKLVILSGPAGDGLVPADYYRRLAADLRLGGARVIVDLAGERLDAALAGGVDVVKVSDEELAHDGRIGGRTVEDIVPVMRELHRAGAEKVIVTRAHEPLLALEGGAILKVTGPVLQVVDSAGAGDSFVGALASRLADGGTFVEALIQGMAAGALNVTRHGLGTGDPETISRLQRLVLVELLNDDDAVAVTPAREVSPEDLVSQLERDG